MVILQKKNHDIEKFFFPEHFFLKTGDYNGDPKNDLAESEGRKQTKLTPKAQETAKIGLGRAEKGLGAFFGLSRPFFVLSRPNKDRAGSERVPEGFPKGWEGIPAGVEGI